MQLRLAFPCRAEWWCGMNVTDHIGEPAWQYRKRNGFIFAGMKDYKGSRFFEIREWTDGAEIKPTRKGITMPPDAVVSLHAALGDWLADQATSDF